MTKDQKQYADQLFKDNPQFPELFLNPAGEWFTDPDFARYSLPKDKDGAVIGKIETVKRPKAESKKDEVNNTADDTANAGDADNAGQNPK
ncbi:hypothetical protein [Chryseobacterium sp. CCH4-E10]|uniref:hypothetical protein n=1 Tax=Chryseobacterium sp. CCH4-E10 TaxID=1768758 RepID=UPI00082C2634|nr:hypothetical protein [Chryseobacterium sp. CCH4-E10]